MISIDPTTIYEDSDLKIVKWDFVLGVRWYDIPTIKSAEQYRGIQARHLRSKGSALIVSWSDAGADRLDFDSGLREAIEATLRDAKSQLLGMAQIVEGEGFGAASVRSVLSGIQLAVRPDYPIQLFGDSQSACPWIEDLLLEAGHPDFARRIGTALFSELEAARKKPLK